MDPDVASGFTIPRTRHESDLLASSGFAGDIALLNGSNSDPESAAIYAEWLERNRGTDKVSGSKTADMKAAVEKLRVTFHETAASR